MMAVRMYSYTLLFLPSFYFPNSFITFIILNNYIWKRKRRGKLGGKMESVMEGGEWEGLK